MGVNGRGLGAAALALALAGLVGCGEKPDMVMMPKQVGTAYSEACERGAKEAADELGIKLVYCGPAEADANEQAATLETWIAQRVGVIAVAPNDPDALAPTLKEARQLGIRVLTWDADSDEDSRLYFVGPASTEDVGCELADVVAEQIDEEGEVAVVAGTLTAPDQNAWLEQMRKRIQKMYPRVRIVAVNALGEDEQKTLQDAKALLAARPKLKGIVGITSVALRAAAQAVRDTGNVGKVAVTGLSSPNVMREFVNDGTVRTFVLWNPVDLGYLTVHAAVRLQAEGELLNGFEAGRLGRIRVEGTEVVLGKPIRFTKANIDQYDF